MKNLILSIAFLSSVNLASACSWWPEGEEIRFSLFSSSLADGDDAYELFYSTSLFNGYKVDAYYGPTENIEEWYNYFGGKFSHDDIDQLIYSYPLDKDQTGLENNKLMQHFLAGNNKEAFDYLMFSKQLELYLKVDYWDQKEMDVMGIEKSIKIAENKVSRVNDPVIKLRYGFQLIVMNYYMMHYDKVDYYYKNVVQKSNVSSVIKEWSRFFWANTLDRDQRLYHLAMVFDNSKAKSKYIFQHFPSKLKDVSGALTLCKNDREKAAIMSLLAFKNPGRASKQIKEIAALNANDELLDILLIREINKMEDWYYTDRYTSYGTAIDNWWTEGEFFDFVRDKNFKSDKTYLEDFKRMIDNIMTTKGVKNRELWFTCLAYMSYMLEDAQETEKYLNLAHQHAKDPEIVAQLAVIELLHLVRREENFDDQFQKQLMVGMNKIDQYENDLYRFDRFKSQLMLAISRKYLEEGQLVLAALFESKVDGSHIYERYSSWSRDQAGYQTFDMMNENATSTDLDALFAYWQKPMKTPLEIWLFEDLEPFRWRLTDLWATQYFREDKLESALQIYETIPDSVWQVSDWRLHYYYHNELDSDPFESNLYGRSYEPNWGKTYTKPEFVKEILRLKGLLKGPVKDKSNYALLLGNAYYNMSYNGNSYYYTEYSWSSYEANDFKRDQTYYYTSERALEYYKQAEDLAPNDAFAAFCYRMQLKCKRDAYYHSEGGYSHEESKKKQIQDWKFFAKKYPDHYKRLTNCDHIIFYSNAWQQG